MFKLQFGTRVIPIGAQYGIGILTHQPSHATARQAEEATIVGVQHANTHRPYPPHRGDVFVDARQRPVAKFIVDADAKLLRGPQRFRGWIAHAFRETEIIRQINQPPATRRFDGVV